MRRTQRAEAPDPDGATIELEIESLAAGGDGVARDATGRVVFVPETAPGDRVRVRPVEERARFARARVEEVLSPSPDRTDPRCPIFGQCGGCAWQHVAYPAQLEAKRRILHDALARIAGLATIDEIAVVASPSPYAYRSRARVHVERGRVGFRRRRSHSVCATKQCAVLVPELEKALAGLAARPPRRDGDWELVAGAEGSLRCAPIAPSSRAEPVQVRVGDDRLRVSSGAFLQANALLFERLASDVVNACGSGRIALELYAGCGLFTLGLARRFELVWAVEANPVTAGDLAANVATASLANVEVVREAVESALARGPLGELRPDTVLLDPPRSGLAAESIERIVGLEPERIVYLSCDPATLARDLGRFAQSGYGLARASVYDLFPQTPHVETLAILHARAADDTSNHGG